MFLYHLTLQRASSIYTCIHGNFAGTKQQEVVVSRGKILEILRIDQNTGKVIQLCSTEVFGTVRSLIPFRLTGGSKDYIVVGSDSGKITILEYNPQKNVFDRVHMETFGKSGCRRIVPGQYLAVDPKGRAVMIAAIEKQKLVYIMNRDDQARLTISSPLEAHKANTIVFDCCGVDVGFENPTFACLELDYEEADGDPTGEAAQMAQQTLTYYELDLGLNHVVRKYSEPLEDHANMLISVPGGNEGPSGVLICSENYITYKNFGDQPDIRCPIPRRRNDLDDHERGMLFVCTATHKTKSMFFFLAQTEQGDIFKITLEVDEDSVTEIKLKYFDTAPVCSSFVVLKTGFLFLASEFGNHYLYQIAHLGEDDDEPEFSSAMPLDEGETFFFQPRPLKNLVLVDEMESLAPILHCNITDLANEDTPQLYTVCGRGPRSTLRVLRHGLEVSEMAVSDLPGSPNAVWTVRKSIHEEYDSYIIVSFVNATLVLSIGETVEEVTDSGFLGTTPTLSCSSIGNDALLQIYPDGIRHIRSDRRINEWKTPGKKYIVKCAVNQRQVVIALTGGELVYFEMDQTGQLNEYTERKDMNSEVICMALPRVPPGEQRARFLAVGLADETVKIISLDTSDCLTQKSTQALPARPESLCIVEMGQQEEGGNSSSTMFLNIGLSIGVLTRTVMDTVTGELSDTRTRYLGTRAVKLFRIPVHGVDAVLAISSRTWLSYFYQSRFHLSPLSYDTLEYACGFSSEQCTQGVVAISSNTLRILALEKLGAVFNQVTMPLKYTPRKFVIDEESSNMILIETDHNTFTENSKNQRKQQIAEEMVETADEESKMEAAKLAEQFLSEDLSEETFSSPKAGNGMWASQIRILSPIKQETLEIIKFEQNEAAFSICICQFNNSPVPGLTYVVVGTSRDLSLAPRQCSGGFLYTYRLVDDGSHMELVHKTPVDDVPTALCPFQGRLLVGVGKLLRIYDLGKKKLLRKCENKHIPNLIVGIKCQGNRILASDNQESVHFVKYKPGENSLVAFADDTFPRWVTQATMLDYYTAAVGDKFGNMAVLRLPQDSKDNVEDDPTGNKAIWDRGLLNGASQKLDMINMFHIGESVTYLELATLIPGGSEALVYTTLSGTIGMFVPFTSREDIDFFQHLEMHMRNEAPPLCGRDHLSYRSSYIPVKATIDGDLCEQYNSLDPSKRKTIADELDRSTSEVSKKLEDMRTTYAF